ncbi:MAG: DUF1772 domain-containing protein [Nitrosospira sp.]|nr:DUF1772 domain-containing protein [Nitrosospira sp.]MDN5935879.1 DUF1772 domain-containing protein [Nitrosospira sp.]
MPPLDELLFFLTFLAALGCGLMAGLFFAFSNFVMKALDQLRPESGIAAMQSINIWVFNPLFMIVFLGTAVICLLLVICSFVCLQSPGTVYLLAGSSLYLIGNYVVTMTFNLPKNNVLGHVDASEPEAVSTWRNYIIGWTRWNHVRTITALAGAALFTIALCR